MKEKFKQPSIYLVSGEANEKKLFFFCLTIWYFNIKLFGNWLPFGSNIELDFKLVMLNCFVSSWTACLSFQMCDVLVHLHDHIYWGREPSRRKDNTPIIVSVYTVKVFLSCLICYGHKPHCGNEDYLLVVRIVLLFWSVFDLNSVKIS